MATKWAENIKIEPRWTARPNSRIAVSNIVLEAHRHNRRVRAGGQLFRGAQLVAREFDDYRLLLFSNGETLTQAGDGLGSFQPVNLAAESWQAVAQIADEFFWRGEFRFRKSLWLETGSELIGLALFEHSGTRGDNQWPVTTLFTLSNAPLSMQLTWQDNASSEAGYVIERRPPGVGAFEPLASLPANATEYGDRYLLVEGVYEYRVKAVAETAESPYARVSGQYPQAAAVVNERLFLPIVPQ